MDWINRLREQIGTRTIILALAGLGLANIIVHEYIVKPGNEEVLSLENDLAKLQKFYDKMEFTDMDAISGALYKQVEFLKKKSEDIFDHASREEELPLLVSKLEELALQSGLSVESNIKSNARGKKKEGLAPIGLSLNYRGSFQQVLAFLDGVQHFDKPLLLNDFEIRRIDDSRVAGKFEFLTMVTRAVHEEI